MRVGLVLRWGSHAPGTAVEVDDVQGAWLVEKGLGRAVAPVPAASSVKIMENETQGEEPSTRRGPGTGKGTSRRTRKATARQASGTAQGDGAAAGTGDI